MLKITAKWKSNLFIVFLLFLIVGSLQYVLLGLILKYGFTPDDWRLLSFYKTLGDDPVSKILYVWSIKGAHTTSQVYFIGVLNGFFSLNYQAYYTVNIILKILATISIYPLVLIIFKRKLLAFLTVIIYGMNYLGSRSLEYVVKGTDYLAIIPMNIFFIIYYLIVIEKVKRWWWFVFMVLFWFLSLFISPIRVYPILFLIPAVELFVLMQDSSIRKILGSVKRLLILYLPLLVIYCYKQDAITLFLQSPPMIFHAILRGNLHFFLTIFQGLGLTWFFLTDWKNIFSTIDTSSFMNYLYFLFYPHKGPLFIFGILTFFLSLLTFKKKLRSFTEIFFLNLLLDIIFYYFAKYRLGIPEILRYDFDLNKMYPILLAGFILCIALVSFREWLSFGKNNKLLFALWITPPIALLYIFLIWLLAPFGVSFENRQGYYLVIPAIAASVFITAILVAIYDKALGQKNRLFRLFLLSIIFFILFNMLLLNKKNIDTYFHNAREDGRFAQDQEGIYNLFLQNTQIFNFAGNKLFYFENITDNVHSNYYYEQALFESLPSKILYKNIGAQEGCIAVLYQGLDGLSNIITNDNGIRGFSYSGQCSQSTKARENIFYQVNNFDAFRIKNGKIINIKREILDKLTFLLQSNK
ncbi:hypothetical protein A3D83_01235 [Candidatus Daviesbacteria bacterium RIFCSPHIGHO2_02_FULL_41_10]|uniref:Glycosyltransferase RgtA/B/C/D-like domain-containing protein n=1 Tax=Candidatus Daviesbacteria bacterium RIFCSPHIGHO2_02_FULL_41_10 TaxID=1797774 RepID=A0A1F5JY63_9BACT|nr:MAG: hypothetical protein A3D83_01235 [Candidatus Daviesbacteria bacterium RIFCSPHIGHO2_02_FULL_41_10]